MLLRKITNGHEVKRIIPWLGVIFFIFIEHTSAKISRFDVSRSNKEEFSFKKVCEIQGAKDYSLISADQKNIDCMGEKFSLLKFCQKVLENHPHLMRGYADHKNKKIICQTGTRLHLAYKCTKNETSQSPCNKNLSVRDGCNKFKNLFASNLPLHHAYKMKNQINCLYMSQVEKVETKEIDPLMDQTLQERYKKWLKKNTHEK